MVARCKTMVSTAVSEGGMVVLGYVVKRIKGRLYVYEQYRKDGKVVTKYVGPLERIVEGYKRCQNMGNGGEAPNWWARGDSNPRPPGYQPGALPG